MILLRNAHGLGIPNFLTHSTAVDTCSTLGIQNMTSCWMVHFPRYGVKIWIPSFFYHIKIGKGDDFYCGRSTKMLGKPMALPRKMWQFRLSSRAWRGAAFRHRFEASNQRLPKNGRKLPFMVMVNEWTYRENEWKWYMNLYDPILWSYMNHYILG